MQYIGEGIFNCRRKQVYKKDVNEFGQNEHGKRFNQRQFIIKRVDTQLAKTNFYVENFSQTDATRQGLYIDNLQI